VASDELVFPGVTGRAAEADGLGKGRPGAQTRVAGKRPMSDMTLTKVLRTAGANKATVHGMRSSFRDWAAEQTSFPGEVVEAALAHTISNKVEAAYRRTNYLEKRRGLMHAWAAFTAPMQPFDSTDALSG
jgi:integrase